MSTADTGDAGFAAKAVAAARLELVTAEEEQLALLDPPTPEEIADVRHEMPNAGNLTVLREARLRRRGRPAGARNKRTDDFARYILSFGQDPAVTLMRIASTPPEVLIENSKRTVKRMTKAGNVVELDEVMSYDAALSLIMRASEALQPYIHSKKPVAIDATIRGVRVVEEIGERRDPLRDAIEGEFVRVVAELDGEQAA